MNPDIPAGLINLADGSLGAQAIWANDEFFAAKERMLSPAEPVFRAGTFDDHGQWMDGWETRRRRVEGHDSCVVRLAYPGVIRLIDLDTRYFTGNFPPQASVDATRDADPLAPGTRWTPILPVRALIGDGHNVAPVDDSSVWRSLRLNIHPDGGIARFRVYGTVRADWNAVRGDELVDLLAIERGGVALQANDQHYGSIRNLNRPGRGLNMGDGWETRRRRTPGHDWVIVKLGHPGTIREAEIDTAHFRGNYPDRVSLQGALIRDLADNALASASTAWPVLLPEQRMSADAQHHFKGELARLGPVSHVRMNIHPDGGVSRLRLVGTIAR
jgi:allantoicase